MYLKGTLFLLFDGHLKTNDYEGFKHTVKGGTETKAMTPEGVEALNRSMVRS